MAPRPAGCWPTKARSPVRPAAEGADPRAGRRRAGHLRAPGSRTGCRGRVIRIRGIGTSLVLLICGENNALDTYGRGRSVFCRPGPGLADGGEGEIPIEVIPVHLWTLGSRLMVVEQLVRPEDGDTVDELRKAIKTLRVEAVELEC